MSRVTVVLAGVLFWLAAAGAASAEMPGWAKDGIIKFKATRNGSDLGYCIVAFSKQGNDDVVDVMTAFRVGVGPFALYHYLLRTHIVWRDGRIVSLDSRVNDDGEKLTVAARPKDGKLAYKGAKAEGLIDADILPSTYWRNDLVTRDKILDSQYGRILSIKMTRVGEEKIRVKGKEVTATRWTMRGELDLDIWYDAAGEWSKLEFTRNDSHVIYERVEPGKDDRAQMVALDKVFGSGGGDLHTLIAGLEK